MQASTVANAHLQINREGIQVGLLSRGKANNYNKPIIARKQKYHRLKSESKAILDRWRRRGTPRRRACQPDKVGGSEGRSSRWDPEGGAGNEGKPIRGGLLDEDPLKDVVELL
ncbi:hypothetical protein M0R45_016218 [Rubus argutus]|uniref:Uncharacterized protein n=1 Tax=Rubus argutus TaxID=59490 RepID=A0AAW1XU94_RUBAR